MVAGKGKCKGLDGKVGKVASECAIHLESKSLPSSRNCSSRPCGFGEDLRQLFIFLTIPR